jgi:ribosomal protein L3 glutamine methyltransferase
VDERVIVPRSFIAELLADGTIDPWLSEQTHTVLDLCTGNGSLAVLAAMAWPEVQVTGADISPMRWPWPASTSSGTAWQTASAWQGDGLHAVRAPST